MAPALARALPNLTSLGLAQNQLAELADLEPLAALRQLVHLVLLENPVALKPVSLRGEWCGGRE